MSVHPAVTSGSSRLKHWILYLVFTIIVLISVAGVDTNPATNENEPSKYDKGWALALSIVTLIFNLAALGMHFHPIGALVIGTKFEAITLFVLTAFWLALVCLVTGPLGGLAMDSEGAVDLGNLYYFTWGGLIMSVVVLADLLGKMFSVDIAGSLRGHTKSFIYWAALLMTSLVVMCVSADYYNNYCDIEDKPEPECSRTILAITAGTIGTVFSLVVVALKLLYGSVSFLLEICFCAILLLLYVFEVGYVTDYHGPGAALNNLYYFSWISFFLTFMVGKSCYDDFQAIETTDTALEEEVAGPVVATMNSEHSNEPKMRQHHAPQAVVMDPEEPKPTSDPVPPPQASAMMDPEEPTYETVSPPTVNDVDPEVPKSNSTAPPPSTTIDPEDEY